MNSLLIFSYLIIILSNYTQFKLTGGHSFISIKDLISYKLSIVNRERLLFFLFPLSLLSIILVLNVFNVSTNEFIIMFYLFSVYVFLEHLFGFFVLFLFKKNLRDSDTTKIMFNESNLITKDNPYMYIFFEGFIASLFLTIGVS